jgi:hypothetical protein
MDVSGNFIHIHPLLRHPYVWACFLFLDFQLHSLVSTQFDTSVTERAGKCSIEFQWPLNMLQLFSVCVWEVPRLKVHKEAECSSKTCLCWLVVGLTASHLQHNNRNRNQNRNFFNYFYSHRVSWKLVKRGVAGPILLTLVA